MGTVIRSRCLDCTECRTIYKQPGKVLCRQKVFSGQIELTGAGLTFLSVERRCLYFEIEGVDGNTSGDKGSLI